MILCHWILLFFPIYTCRFIPSRAIVNLTRGFLSTPPQVCHVVSARKFEQSGILGWFIVAKTIEKVHT